MSSAFGIGASFGPSLLLHDAISAENDNAMCDTRLASHDDEHIRSLVLVTRPHIIRSK